MSRGSFKKFFPLFPLLPLGVWAAVAARHEHILALMAAQPKKITIDQEIPPPSHSLRAYNRHERDIVYPDVYESIDVGACELERLYILPD